MTSDLMERLEFFSVPEPNTGCLLWLASCDQDGYGKLSIDGRTRRAHRVAYELAFGPVPPGLQLDHRACSTPCCINPLHLEAVTQWVNGRRSGSPSAVNARKTHCNHGHPLSGANLRVDSDGCRRCRVCVAEKDRAYCRRAGPRSARRRALLAAEVQG